MDNDNSVSRTDTISESEIVPEISSNWTQINSRFEQIKLKSSLLKLIRRKYEKLLPLQCQALSPCCLGKDTLIASPANSGKTSTAIISVLNTINVRLEQCQAVFLLPSVEKAAQVKNLISNFLFGPDCDRYVCDVSGNCVGRKCFTKGVRIIVGTPQTLLALLSSKSSGEEYAIRSVVFDETELLLSAENMQPLNSLVREYFAWHAQSILLCTTVSKEIREFVGENMPDPVKIIVNTKEELARIGVEANLVIANSITNADSNKKFGPIPMEVESISTASSKYEDEFDLMAKQLAVKLRNLPQNELLRIKKFLDLTLFDPLPKYYLIDGFIAKTLSDSTINRSTQTTETDCRLFCEPFDNKFIDASSLDQKSCSNVMTYTTVKWIRNFEDAPLKRPIKNGLRYDFKVPLLLQQKSMKLLLNGYDVLIQSPRESGKTTAIVMNALNLIDTDKSEVQTVIVVPTLELIHKTVEIVKIVGQFMQNLKYRSIRNVIESKSLSDSDAHMLITVPEIVTSMNLSTSNLKLFTIEQIDEIFFDTFDKLIGKCVNLLPVKCQIVLSSSSQCNPVYVQLIGRLLLKVNITSENLLLHGVRQFSLPVRNEHRKYNYLNELMKKLKSMPVSLIFCNTVQEVTYLQARFSEDGVVSAVALFERLDETGFDEFFKKFTQKDKKFIITWDYCAPSIDIAAVSAVINYVLPFRHEHFIERIRRSGRYKHKSIVVHFVAMEEMRLLADIQNEYGFVSKQVANWADIEFENHTA